MALAPLWQQFNEGFLPAGRLTTEKPALALGSHQPISRIESGKYAAFNPVLFGAFGHGY